MSVYASNDIPAKTSKVQKDGFELVTAVANCNPMYWVREGEVIREMTETEKLSAYPVTQPTDQENALSEISQRDDLGTDIRMLEDVVGCLVSKGVITLEDLPEAAQVRILARQSIRTRIRGE